MLETGERAVSVFKADTIVSAENHREISECFVFGNSQGYDVDLWSSCRFHLYAGALCMYACVVMERLFKGVRDEYQAVVFAENRWLVFLSLIHP